MENKTIKIKVILAEAQSTGLISEEALEALNAEKVLAEERIENLRKFLKADVISPQQFEAKVRGIQQELQEKILLLKI